MNRHLSSTELVDLAEGTRPRRAAPHLEVCDACRRQLAELEAALSSAAGFDVPEPSPLFWDQLSARVREAVRAGNVPERGRVWPGAWFRPALFYPLAGTAIAGLLIAVMLTSRGGAPSEPARASVSLDRATPISGDVLSDDPSLGLVADLTADMDWDTARDAGLTAEGSAEHAVTHLNDDELGQLRLLLQKELARPGA